MNPIIRLGSLAAIAAMLSVPSYAAQEQEEVLCNFAPENSMQIPAGLEMSRNGGIDEATFNAVIDKVVKVYEPIVKARGGKLKVNRKWNDSTVNASATRMFHSWTLNMYGGLARHPKMTADGFAMVVCHELGHHLGGYPNMRTLFGRFSNEGEADYFATMKCFRRVFENDDNLSVLSTMSVPKEVTAGCTRTFKSQKEIAVCQRSSMTAKVLADTLWSLGRGHQPDGSKGAGEPAKEPLFNTPSTAQVGATVNGHPLSQCRLDTMFNGSICGVSYTEDFSMDNATVGACAEEKGDRNGYRPRCWYKPGSTARRSMDLD